MKVGNICADITQTAIVKDFVEMLNEQPLKKDNLRFVAEVDSKAGGYIIRTIVSGILGIKRSTCISTMSVIPDQS